MSSIAQYEALVATVETGSLAKAAQALNLTPSAVSKQLTALEQELGVVLLERRSRTLTLTESGEVFYRRCLEILAKIDSAEREAQATRDELSGDIRITMSPSLIHSPLPALLQSFSELYPEVRFQLRVNDAIEDLVTGRIDFALRIGKLADNRLVAIPLVELKPVFCASPSYIRRQGQPRTFEDLHQHHVMLPSMLNLSVLNRSLFGRGKALENVHTADDINMVLACTLSGLNISVLLEAMVSREVESGNLVRLFPDESISGKKLYLVHAKQGVLPKRLRLFKQFIKAEWQ